MGNTQRVTSRGQKEYVLQTQSLLWEQLGSWSLPTPIESSEGLLQQLSEPLTLHSLQPSSLKPQSSYKGVIDRYSQDPCSAAMIQLPTAVCFRS